MPHSDAEARVEDGRIVITVAISNLQRIVHGAWAAGYAEPVRITDTAAFAEAMCAELNSESEDGTTPLHRLFDEAASGAFERGEGEEMSEDEAEEMAAEFQKLAGASE